MISRAVAASVSYLNDELRKQQFKYSLVLTGKARREDRWKECVKISLGRFQLSLASFFVKRYFNEYDKKNALGIVNDVREEMYNILGSIDWMDEETR